jgi:hypothetical protein
METVRSPKRRLKLVLHGSASKKSSIIKVVIKFLQSVY